MAMRNAGIMDALKAGVEDKKDAGAREVRMFQLFLFFCISVAFAHAGRARCVGPLRLFLPWFSSIFTCSLYTSPCMLKCVPLKSLHRAVTHSECLAFGEPSNPQIPPPPSPLLPGRRSTPVPYESMHFSTGLLLTISPAL